jgi:hypothetical protein
VQYTCNESSTLAFLEFPGSSIISNLHRINGERQFAPPPM